MTPYFRKTLIINIFAIVLVTICHFSGFQHPNYPLLAGILLFFDIFFITTHSIFEKHLTAKNFNKAYMIYSVVKLMTFIIFFAILAIFFKKGIIFTALFIFVLYFAFTFNEVKQQSATLKKK